MNFKKFLFAKKKNKKAVSFNDNLKEKKKKFIEESKLETESELDLAISLALTENFDINKKESLKLVKNNVLTKNSENNLDKNTEITELHNKVKLQIEKFGGKKIISNEGGGNCLFHTLSAHLNVSHEQLREDSVNYITCSWERFKEFSLNPSTLQQFESKDDYLNYMIKDGSWGDHLSLLALCELYQINAIIIITEGTKVSDPIKINVDSEVNVLIRFNSEFHYEAII